MTRFSNLTIARDATDAFNTLREEALYQYGHGRKTDTIADKSDFIRAGVLGSTYLDLIPQYWLRTVLWHANTHKNRRQYPKGIPVSVAPLFAEAADAYVDPEGPAVCFQIVGARVPEIKASMGLKGKWGNAYWFGGTT